MIGVVFGKRVKQGCRSVQKFLFTFLNASVVCTVGSGSDGTCRFDET